MKVILNFLIILAIQKSTAQIISTSEVYTSRVNGFKTIVYHTTLQRNDSLIADNKQMNVYYKAGNIKESYSLMLGQIETGLHFKFYENGLIKESYRVFNNQFVGNYLSFYSNGKSKVIGEYKDVNNYSELNYEIDSSHIYNKPGKIIGTKFMKTIKPIKTGLWYYYESNGNLIRKEYYK